MRRQWQTWDALVPNPLPPAGEGGSYVTLQPNPLRAGAGLWSGRDALTRSAFGAAVARRDVLFLGIRGRRLLDHGAHQIAIRSDPVGDDDPLGAVPLLEFDRAAAFMVQARHLERLHEACRAELLETRFGDGEVLEAPADLLAGQRLLAVLLLRLADRLDGQDAV